MINRFQGKYRFLSNFWPVEVMLDGLHFPSVEHAYVAAKSLDDDFRLMVSKTKSPGEAKRLGKTVKLRPDWEEVKFSIMESLLRQKFQRADLQYSLLLTGDELLQEGNTWGDKVWGVDLRTGKGENNLGKLLMKIRAEL